MYFRGCPTCYQSIGKAHWTIPVVTVDTGRRKSYSIFLVGGYEEAIVCEIYLKQPKSTAIWKCTNSLVG